MRVMGLDLGDKTIGVALSDPLGWTAQGLEVIRRKGSLQQDLQRLKELALQYEVELIVVGLPRNMNGSLGERGQKSLDFVEKLKTALSLPVKTWDERLSTVAAEKLLLQADVSRAKRKKVIDKMAAAVILQNYLDANLS